MRAAAALALTLLGGVAGGAAAQDYGAPVADRIDGAALRLQILQAQVACRDQVKAGGAGRSPRRYVTPPKKTSDEFLHPGLAFDMGVRACMGARGYTARDPTPDELAAFKASGKTDPYAEILQYELAPRQATTVIRDVDAQGQVTETYLVGRF